MKAQSRKREARQMTLGRFARRRGKNVEEDGLLIYFGGEGGVVHIVFPHSIYLAESVLVGGGPCAWAGLQG